MGFFDGFFSDKKTQNQSSTQSGSTNYGLTPQVTDYWSQIQSLYNPQSWSPVGPNQYQEQAAGNQAGYASNLMTPFGAASGIATGGISTGDISRFMSPYTQNVVDATRNDFATQNARENAANQGQAAKLGALGGTNAMVARNLASESQRRQQDPIIAGLYNQGYSQAADMAAKSTSAQLGGIGAASNIAGTQGALNNQLYGMGQGFTSLAQWNAMQPYQIAGMGASTLGSLIPGSGQTTTGSSTGTGTTIGTPSPFSIAANLAGLGIQAFSDERVKENIKTVGETFDGQPIYKFNYKGDPRTTMGLMAQDVEKTQPEAVGSFAGIKTVDYDKATRGAERARKMADGGSVSGSSDSDPHGKFIKAFDTISGLLKKARGGSVMRPFAGGGEVSEDWNTPLPMEMAAPAQGQWSTTATPAGPPTDWKKIGNQVSALGKPSLGSGDDNYLQNAQRDLSTFLGGMSRPRFDLGGEVSRTDIAPVGSLDRTAFTRDLEDPKTRSALLALAHAEVGGQGPEAQQAFLETVFNRAAARGKSLSDTIYDRGYYPTTTYDRMNGPVPADHYAPILDKVLQGSNTSQYATGNASGTVGFNKGPQTVAYNGERFGIEGPDRKWADSVRSLPNMGGDYEGARLAASISAPPPATAGGETIPTAARMAGPAVASAEAPQNDGWLTRFLPGLKEGVFAGKPMTGAQTLGAALMSVRGPMFEGPLNGFARSIMESNKARMEERGIDNQVAQMLGELNGKPTLDAKKLAQHTADAEATRKQAADIALGTVSGQPTVAARQAESAIAGDKLQQEAAQLKLDEQKNPERIYERRSALADKYGLTGENRLQFIFDGKIPDKAAATETTEQKEVAKAGVEMAQKNVQAAQGAQDTLRIVDELRVLPKEKNFEAAIGPADQYSLWQSIMGMVPMAESLGLANPKVNAHVQRLQSQLSLAGGEKMKGLGAQSDADAARLEKAVSNLGSARNKTEFYDALRIIEESVVNSYNRGVSAAKKFPKLNEDMSRLEPRKVLPPQAEAIKDAKDAIARGADRAKVQEELRAMGIDPSGI